jgi:hypothetical protein
MGHIVHLSHLGKYWKILAICMHFIFFCGHYTQFHVMCKGGHCLVTPQAYSCGLGVGISRVLEIIGDFLYKKWRLWDNVVWSWPTYHQQVLDIRNKNIYGLGVEFSTVLRYLGTSYMYMGGGQDHSVWSSPIYHQMLRHTRNNNLHGLEVGISMVFEIIGHLLFKGGRDHHVRSWLTYHQMLLDTRNKNIYGLGVGISTVFEIFGHFMFNDGLDHPYGLYLHTIWCSLIQGTRIYTVWGWRIQQFSRYKKCPLLFPHPIPMHDDFSKRAFVLCLKTFMLIWALWANWFLRRSIKYVPFIAHVKTVSHIVAPPEPRGSLILTAVPAPCVPIPTQRICVPYKYTGFV